MKESYSEGIANHTGPESCAGSREAIGEALTGVRAGQDIEPRKVGKIRGSRRASSGAEGNNLSPVIARTMGSPRGRRPCACTETPRAGTGRARVWPGQDGGQVRSFSREVK